METPIQQMVALNDGNQNYRFARVLVSGSLAGDLIRYGIHPICSQGGWEGNRVESTGSMQPISTDNAIRHGTQAHSEPCYAGLAPNIAIDLLRVRNDVYELFFTLEPANSSSADIPFMMAQSALSVGSDPDQLAPVAECRAWAPHGSGAIMMVLWRDQSGFWFAGMIGQSAPQLEMHLVLEAAHRQIVTMRQ